MNKEIHSTKQKVFSSKWDLTQFYIQSIRNHVEIDAKSTNEVKETDLFIKYVRCMMI